MPHITLSIPRDLYRKMKEHPEIKWTEIARRGIEEYMAELVDEIDSGELVGLLDKEAVEIIRSLSDEELKRMFEEMVSLEWQRMKSLTRTY